MENKRIELLISAAKAEAVRAKELFPESEHLTLAHAEESGEVTKAALDYFYGKGDLHQLDKEIVQCMAMCIRLWSEGDPSINLPPCDTI